MPGVIGNIRGFAGVALAATYWIWRKEPFHALDVSGRGAVAGVHIAATNPFCARCHTDLITHPVVTDHCTGGMRAVSLVIARKRRIIAARITDGVMDGVVPVKVVIGVLSVPATIVRLEGVMRPAHSGVCAGNDNILPSVTQRPHLGGVRVIDPGLDRVRSLEL